MRIKKALILLSLIAGFIILALIIFNIINRPKTLEIENFSEIPGYNLDEKYLFSKESVIFSNGRYLVDYNYNTGKTTKKSNTTKIENIDEITKSPDGSILLKSNSVYPLGKSDEFSGWWKISKNITSESNIFGSKVKFLNDGSYAYIQNSTIKITSGSTENIKTLISLENEIRDYQYTDDSLYLIDLKGNIYKKSNDKTIKLFSNQNDAVFSNKSGCYVRSEGEDHTSNSNYTVEGCLDKEKTYKYIGSRPDFSEDGNLLIFKKSEDKSNFTVYDLRNKKTTLLKIKGENNVTNIDIVNFIDLDHIVFRKDNQLYTQTKIHKKNTSSIPSFSLNGIMVDFDTNSQTLILSKGSNISDEEVQIIQDSLTKKGYNIDLLKIEKTEPKIESRWD